MSARLSAALAGLLLSSVLASAAAPPRHFPSRVERLLKAPFSLHFERTPLSQVLDDLRDFCGLNIVADMPALRKDGVSLDSPVAIKLNDVSLKSSLHLILHQPG